MDRIGTSERDRLLGAIADAKAGRWEAAHKTAQALEGDARADWLHAILHKIEGDGANSRYWYGRTRHTYDNWAESHEELEALARELRAGS